jgi:acetylornithine deacetylase
MPELRKALEAAAARHLPEARDLLCDLIRIPSVAGQERPAIDCMRDRCRELKGEIELVPVPDGITADEDYSFGDEAFDYTDRPNFAFHRRGRGGGRSLLFSSHLDVVPADPAWKDAFSPQIEGDRVIGRGACDAKGQVATAWLTLRLLDAVGVETKGTVSSQFVIEEEVGGNGALGMILAGQRADGALVMEGTDLQVHPANRGAVWYRLRITGKSVHMGRIREGVSAHDKAIQAIEIMRRYEQRLIAESRGQPLFVRYEQPVQLNVGIVRAGDWPSTVPGECLLEGGVGFLPNKRLADVKRELEEALRAEADEWTREHFQLDFPKLHNDAYQTDPAHPFVQATAAACAEAGLKSEVFGWNVSCDARLYHHRGKMPTVVFGPGQISQAHATGEWIDVRQMGEAATAMALLVARWCEMS